MISIVIPIYNKQNSIENTINSVLEQTFKEFELIIVNDGSTDNGLTEIEKIRDSRIKIITQKNQGVSIARNTGVLNSQFDLIAILDADDTWQSNFLEEILKLIEICPEASLFGCASFLKWPNNKITDTTFGLDKDFKGYLTDYFKVARENTLFNSSSVLFKKNDFIEIGMFDKTLSKGEDIDLWIRFALNKKIAFYNKPLTTYHLDAQERAGNKKIEKSKSLIWNLKKYENLNNSRLNIFLDNWRLAHISNYLNRKCTEIDQPFTLLNEIKSINLSPFHKILKFLPIFLHVPFYYLWKQLKQK